jgi:hypothetical protein
VFSVTVFTALLGIGLQPPFPWVPWVSVAAGTCLPSHWVETALVYLLISRPLHGNVLHPTVCTQLWTELFIFRSGLSNILIACNRTSEGILYCNTVLGNALFCGVSVYKYIFFTNISPYEEITNTSIYSPALTYTDWGKPWKTWAMTDIESNVSSIQVYSVTAKPTCLIRVVRRADILNKIVLKRIFKHVTLP